MSDRTVFITGCSSGIGRAAALRFAERGYRVIATSRKHSDLEELQRRARNKGWALQAEECDVSSDDSMQRAIEFAHGEFGSIHILVNNAGYGLMGPVEAISPEEIGRQFEVNTFGPMRLVQLVAPDMRAAGWGRIINISSIAGRIVIPFGGWYSASKFALEALSDALRIEMEPFGISVVSILPGPVKTGFVANSQVHAPKADEPEWYKNLYGLFDQRRARERPFAISAEKLARVIVHAAEARHPKPRYVLTLPARAGIFARRFISDRLMDRILSRFYQLNRIRDESEDAR